MTVTETVTSIEVTGGLHSGIVSSATSTVLTVSGASFGSSVIGRLVWIRSGTGSQQIRRITAQTSTTLTVEFAFTVTPDNTSGFIVSHSTADIPTSTAVIKNNNNVLITKHLDIGSSVDTPSFFADENKNIILDNGVDTMLWVRRSSCFQLGLVDEFDNTYSGCAFRLRNCGGDIIWIDTSGGTQQSSDSGDIYFYRSTVSCQPTSGNGFWRVYRGSSQIFIALDCIFDTWRGIRVEGTNSRIKNVYITNQSSSVGSITTKGALKEIKNLQVVKSNFAFYYFPQLSGTISVENVIGLKTNGLRVLVNPSLTEAITFINSFFDTWAITWNTFSGDPLNTVSTNITVIRAFRYNIKVLFNSAGTAANIGIYDKNNVEVVLTTSNGTTGVTPEQILEYGRYSNNVGNGLTFTVRSPYLVRARTYGRQFEEYTIADTDASATMSDTVRLVTNLSVVKTSANAANIAGVSINFISNTITFSGVSIQDAYDFAQYQLSLASNLKYASDFRTDGIGNYFLESWTPIFNGINALTGSGKIVVAGTAQYTNGGTTSLTVQDLTGTTTTFTLTGLIVGSEIRIYLSSNGSDFAGIENCLTSSQSFAYTHTSNFLVNVVVFKEDYIPVNLTGIVLTNTAQSIQVQQRFDGVYSNP